MGKVIGTSQAPAFRGRFRGHRTQLGAPWRIEEHPMVRWEKPWIGGSAAGLTGGATHLRDCTAPHDRYLRIAGSAPSPFRRMAQADARRAGLGGAPERRGVQCTPYGVPEDGPHFEIDVRPTEQEPGKRWQVPLGKNELSVPRPNPCGVPARICGARHNPRARFRRQFRIACNYFFPVRPPRSKPRADPDSPQFPGGYQGGSCRHRQGRRGTLSVAGREGGLPRNSERDIEMEPPFG